MRGLGASGRELEIRKIPKRNVIITFTHPVSSTTARKATKVQCYHHSNIHAVVLTTFRLRCIYQSGWSFNERGESLSGAMLFDILSVSLELPR